MYMEQELLGNQKSTVAQFFKLNSETRSDILQDQAPILHIYNKIKEKVERKS